MGYSATVLQMGYSATVCVPVWDADMWRKGALAVSLCVGVM